VVVGPAFALAAAIGLAIPLVGAGNRRNYVFVALLVALDLVFHLAALGAIATRRRSRRSASTRRTRSSRSRPAFASARGRSATRCRAR